MASGTRLILAGALFAIATAAQAAQTVDVYKSPYCGCCGQWVEHMKAAGFDVRVHETNDLSAKRKELGMPESVASCHTAQVGNYAIEGHVPAGDVKRLLAQKPQVRGIAVPAMPSGAPGMNGTPTPYETLLVNADGSTRVFARH